ncbi:MAG: DnaA/Hda family protein [Spirosomataceae bacterium]
MNAIKEITLDDLSKDFSFFNDLKGGNFVLVLGAGFSYGLKNRAGSDIPIVIQFVEITNTKFGSYINDIDYNTAADTWYRYIESAPDDLEKEKRFKEFKDLFLLDEVNFKVLKSLYSTILLPQWARIYTFNFDNVLDVLIEEVKDSYEVQYYEAGSFSPANKKGIGYLHNSILKANSISDLVFTNTQYGEKILSKDNHLYFSLFNDVKIHHKNLVIIGCQFNEQTVYTYLFNTNRGIRDDLKIINVNFSKTNTRPNYGLDVEKKLNDNNWINCSATDFLHFLKKNESKLAYVDYDDFDPYHHQYVGRTQQLEEIKNYLENPAEHFLFLHGAGGIGKTHALKTIVQGLSVKYKYVKLTESFNIFTLADKLQLGRLNDADRYNDFKNKLKDEDTLIIIDDLYNVRADKNLYDFIVGLSRVSYGKIILISRTLPEEYTEIGITINEISFNELNEDDHEKFVREYYQLVFKSKIKDALITKIWNISKGYPLISELLIANTIYPDFNIDDIQNWDFEEDNQQKTVISRLLDTYLKHSNQNEKELILDISTAIDDVNLEIVKLLPSYKTSGRTTLNSILKRKHIIRFEEGGAIKMHSLIRELLYEKAGDRTQTHTIYGNYYQKIAIESNYNNMIAFNQAFYHYSEAGDKELEEFKDLAKSALVNVKVKQLLSDNIDADVLPPESGAKNK